MDFTANIYVLVLSAFYGTYGLMSALGSNLPWRNLFIGLFSLALYTVWYPPAVLLILYEVALVHWGGRLLVRKQKPRFLLGALIILSLIPLAVFKYYNFFSGLTGLGPRLDLILPIGISFYMFTAIGYFVDLYRREIAPLASFADAVLFIACWPALPAGPILRAVHIMANMGRRRPLTRHNLLLIFLLIAGGLIKKLLIADNIGAYVNYNLELGPDGLSGPEAWATVAGFGAQIYADFSGYSDMAIGFALLLGFRLPANFNYPYVASSITEFWRRWHISLSTWFRDYLYIPLGGSRTGPVRTCFNIFIVFLISGLWHGAGLAFILWGAVHGLGLILEKMGGRLYFRTPKILRHLITLCFVITAWAFFRLDIGPALTVVEIMYSPSRWQLNDISQYYAAPLVLISLIVCLEHLVRFYHVNKAGFPYVKRPLVSTILVCILLPAALYFNGKALPFIYFQF